MPAIIDPNAAYCPVCRNQLKTGQLFCEAELLFGGLMRPVPVHAACGERLVADPDHSERTIEELERAYDLAQNVMRHRLAR